MEDSDEKIAKELTCISKYNDEKNEFPKLWDKWVMDFITSGPTIAMVTWDNEWIGGKGPDKWVGDVRLTRCSKWDMYFDPAITDLETSESLQQCSYIIRRPRKKLKFIKDTWGKDVSDELNEDELINEGNNPEQAYLVEYWHRGFPHYVDDKSAGMFRDKALELESTNEYYKAQDYYDRAKGNLNGIHVAYYANGVLLEYVPYVYEHGLYPFVFTTRFDDEKNPWGFSEIRNLKIPQIAHNKADEIEMEAMSRQGLGGYFYTKGAISPKQRDKIVESNGKGGMMFEVDNAALLQARQGVSVPASIPNYKEHKMRMINQISGNTDIMQGQSPGAGVPFASLQQLGARADVRMGAITGKLEGFLKGINKLRIELFTEFYTEERYYRLKNIDGTKEKVPFTRDTFMKEYQYETGITDTGESIPMLEKFTPELDISVRILSEKPTDRGYYTNLAFQLYQLQLIDYEDLLKTLDEGKLPSIELLIQKLKDKAQQAQLQQMIQQPPQGPPLM
jgi:hypothetical protein